MARFYIHVLTGTLFCFLVSPSLANPTLQSLLTAPVSLQNGQLMGGDGGIQIVTIQSSPTDLLPAHLDANGKIWHVINPATLIAVDDSTDFKPVSIVAGKISLIILRPTEFFHTCVIQ